MKDFQPDLEICPFCKSKGNCHNQGLYKRNLIDFICGRVDDSETISISRIKCKSCGHTHAILPDVIVPYASYSLLFILRAIAEYLTHLHTVEYLTERFGISHSLLYKWLHMYEEHKALWLGALDNKEISDRTFLKMLCLLDDFSYFSIDFLRLISTSFLQHHANPVTNSSLP